MSFASTLRSLLTESYLFLPFILTGWSFFMGIVQGNVALLVLFLGQAMAVPLAAKLINMLMQFISNTTGFIDKSRIVIEYPSDTCRLFPGEGPLDAAPTMWMAQLVFFFSFLLSNAGALYSRKEKEGSDPEKVNRRKAQALFSIVISSILAAGLFLVRWLYMGCDTTVGVLVALATMAPLGYGWYTLAEACSARDADIFGIVQKILPPNAQDQPPVTCVYQGADKTA